MKIDLEPHYRNYWLDLAREEEKSKNQIKENKRKKAISELMKTINWIFAAKKKKKP